MKFISTCYGELINAEHVKYFSVNYAERDDKAFVDVRADGVTVKTFKVEKPPVVNGAKLTTKISARPVPERVHGWLNWVPNSTEATDHG